MATITETLVHEHAVYREVFDQIERVLAGSQSASEVKLLASVVEVLLTGHGETETDLAYSALDHALADRGALKCADDQFRRIPPMMVHLATRVISVFCCRFELQH